MGKRLYKKCRHSLTSHTPPLRPSPSAWSLTIRPLEPSLPVMTSIPRLKNALLTMAIPLEPLDRPSDLPQATAFKGLLPLTSVLVDNFTATPGASIFFLSHFHAGAHPISSILFCSLPLERPKTGHFATSDHCVSTPSSQHSRAANSVTSN